MQRSHTRYLPRTWHAGATPMRGFTAIELMVVVAIMAVLAALAAPSFTPLMEGWRVRQATEALQSTIYYARSEAIKRGGNVTIDPDSSGWANGWDVRHQAGTPSLQRYPSSNNTSIKLVNSDTSAAVTSIFIDRWGMLSDSPTNQPIRLEYLVTPTGKDEHAAAAAKLCIARGGRVGQIKGNATCSI
ncbi:MAG TPA: GspH/FimT family pseudopilin [Alicycliphilus sp.]|nr:GspH/FimT family pseudopilin [Alicycliphilus sp.]